MSEDDKKEVQEMITKALGSATEYQTRKRGDTPTDDLQLTPRKYVNQNGSVASRPIGSVAQIGQKYFASDTNIPMWFTAQKTWVNGVGSLVASS
jgi:hypothetical protein